MGPKAVTFSEEDKAIVNKLNALLDQLHVPSRINTVADIGAGVFVTLYEGLCGEQLPGIIRSASTREDEIHNCQIVIDSLAGDVLHTSLTHISGADVIDGSREGINNLAEIFSGLLEYMLNKIDSDASTDNEDGQNLTTDDPDLITREQIDEILESELRRERLINEAAGIKNAGPTARWVEESSPPRRRRGEDKDGLDLTVEDLSLSPAKDQVDSTADLIRETEELERRLLEEKRILEATKQQKERLLNSRTDRESRFTGDTERMPEPKTSQPQDSNRGRKSPVAERPEKTEGLVRERESRADLIRRLENDPRYKYMLPPSQSQTQAQDEETDETFKSLQNMVEETAAMARAAVDCSPSRAKSMLENLEAVNSQRRAVAASKSPFRGQGRSGVNVRSRRDQQDLRQRTNKRASPSARRASPKATDKLSDTELTPSRAKRKVSFLVERSLTDSSPSVGNPSPVKGRTGAKSRSSAAASGSYLSFEDMYSDKENTSYEDRLKKQYHDILANLSDEGSPERFRSAADYRKDKYKQLASRPRALYTVGDTQKLVEQEKQSGKKKIGFLQKIYREDLDELLDEAEYLMGKNRQTAKEMEKEYQKKMFSGVKTKPKEEKEGPSVLKKKTRRAQPKAVSSKVKKSTPGTSLVKPQKKTLTIKDDDDILPMLLEEFPHLHLSLHTWHELWRKGLTQIEQVTRAHQEVRRKKSHAQNQLEEAEKRQEILVNIMKKELEHNQRLKEIKERQASAISSRNKIHERRMQSARSRHYYDEYQVRMRSKMLKRRTREEMVFKKLFKDGLEIQKERISELRKYAKEQRDGQAKTQRDEIESMENYYRDQFQMLAENIAKEKKELEVREKAQHKALSTMKKDLRKKMEGEIKLLQEQLVRDDDDTYFRQLDADRVIHDLKMAKYQVRV
ncbi:centrosomal protein of 95 kDa-like isoform X2 [Mercenaria mercenaria]|uniref:centrosomal protein of 95 kDa-like isoform X2 n=1 Tax=Mercenaria mercenaria TaxID=6596 RepID=UPI00234F8DF4|nr:centrosomal protein of 95 kDa-like isoform X2 [Mercenaria mercenaria]